MLNGIWKKLMILMLCISLCCMSVATCLAEGTAGPAETNLSASDDSDENGKDQTLSPADASGSRDGSPDRMAGGWEMIPHEAEKLPKDAQAAFDKAADGLVGMKYTPVALMATQVVAGTNYCILCQISPVVPEPELKWALVYIYADLQGNAEITNVYELYIDRHS